MSSIYTMVRQSLYFTQPHEIKILEEEIPEPTGDQLLVQTLCSAISAGVESLIYCGHFPQELPLDENIPSMLGPFAYPLKYGYSVIGEVIQPDLWPILPGWARRFSPSTHMKVISWPTPANCRPSLKAQHPSKRSSFQIFRPLSIWSQTGSPMILRRGRRGEHGGAPPGRGREQLRSGGAWIFE